MNARLINLAYQPALLGFDDRPLRAALEETCAAEINEYFFVVDGIPHMTCFVKSREGDSPPKLNSHIPEVEPELSRTGVTTAVERRDPRAELSAEEAVVYESLRAWRMAKAQSVGVPAFRVLSNRQLAAIARERPRDTDALARLPGIGATRAENYGAELLALVAAGTAEPTTELDATSNITAELAVGLAAGLTSGADR